MSELEVHNDAHLVQLVRSTLGRNIGASGAARINASSCKGIITLHGAAYYPQEIPRLEDAVKQVPGVRGVINKLSSDTNHPITQP